MFRAEKVKARCLGVHALSGAALGGEGKVEQERAPAVDHAICVMTQVFAL
jgi:hypothetical protein